MRTFLIVAALLAGCARSSEKPFAYRVPPRVEPARPVEEPPSVELTLEEALRLMETHHPDLAAARAEVEAAQGRADQAGRLPNPELIGRVESAPFEGNTGGDAEYVAGVAQRLPIGGRLGAAVGAAERAREAAERRHRARRRELQGGVESSFAAALYLNRVYEARQGAVEIARRAIAFARIRVEAGEATPGEVAQAELEYQKELMEQERMGGLAVRATHALTAAIGKPDLPILSLQGNLEEAMGLPELETLLGRLDGDALVAAARADAEAARERLALEEASRIPDINLEFFYRRIGPTDMDAFDAGLGASIPLFDANAGNIRAARAEVKRAEARSRSVRNERERLLRSAHDGLASALERARTFRDRILPRADRVLRDVELGQAEGDVSMAELLPARRKRIDLTLVYLAALKDVQEAWARLRLFLPQASPER